MYGYAHGVFPTAYGAPPIYGFPNQQQFPVVPGLYFPPQNVIQPSAPDIVEEWNVPTPYHFPEPPKVGEYTSTNPKYKKMKLGPNISAVVGSEKKTFDGWLQSWKEKYFYRGSPQFSKLEILEQISSVQTKIEELKQQSLAASSDQLPLLQSTATNIEKILDELNDPVMVNLLLSKQQKRLRKKVSPSLI